MRFDICISPETYAALSATSKANNITMSAVARQVLAKEFGVKDNFKPAPIHKFICLNTAADNCKAALQRRGGNPLRRTKMTDLTAIKAKLSEYDFVVAIDKSGSMGETDMPGGKSRWDYVKESALAFTRDICAIDSDGIGVVLFGGASVTSDDGCNADKVKAIFEANRPMGTTPLHTALEAAFKLAGKSAKKDFIIVFTDGVPDDKSAAAKLIVNHANAQETDDACTVLFVQVGKDAGAAAYLRSLDDDLKGAKFDIVDAKTLDEAEAFASTAELVFAAIND